MFAVELPTGQIIPDEQTEMPSGDVIVDWIREYPVDPEQKIFRASPIFDSASSAVAWLYLLIVQRQWQTSPHLFTGPVTAVPLAERDAASAAKAGENPLNAYDGHAVSSGQQMPSYLFRGERGRYPYASTLGRCLLPWDSNKRPAQSDIVAAVTAESVCTHRFVKDFFGNKDMRRRFPWMADYNLAMRSAVARHYGFGSWFTDFTVDPAIAAWFATGAEARPPVAGELGVITVVDEARVGGFVPNLRYEKAASGISLRRWLVDVRRLFANSRFTVDNQTINWIGAPDFWARLRKARINLRLEIRHSYAPGPEVGRMWKQKWCSVEPKINDWLIFSHTYNDIHLAEQLIARMASRIYFVQDGSAFTQPLGNVTADHLMPGNDELTATIEAFKTAQNLNPGVAAAALWSASR